MSGDTPRPVTVAELRAMLAGLDDALPVVVVAYEGGYSNLSLAAVSRVAWGSQTYTGQHDSAIEADDGADIRDVLFLGGISWGPRDEDFVAVLLDTEDEP